MYLPEYLAKVFSEHGPDEPIPDWLGLPGEMESDFEALLYVGRKRKTELGYALRFNPKTGRIQGYDFQVGYAHDIHLPYDPRKFSFGNFHCHPALRYKDGQPAHSPADACTFEKNGWKPVFIAFVASGKAYTNYALLSTKGTVRFKTNLARSMQTQTDKKLTSYYDINCPVKKQIRDQMLCDIMSASTLEQLKQAQKQAEQNPLECGGPLLRRFTVKSKQQKTAMVEQLETDFQRATPRFGLYAQQVSLDNMKSLVESCGLAFYRSVRGNPHRLVRYQW